MFSFMFFENMFLLFFFFIGALQAVCPSGWLAWQDSCYMFMPDKMSWPQAEKACNRLGANLVVPNSQIEQDFIWLKFKDRSKMFASGTKDLWIDCKKTGEDRAGTLECPVMDGDPAYQNWAGGQPDSGSQGECVRMTERFDGKWGDIGCSYTRFAACEMEAVPYSRAAMKFNLVPRSCLINHHIKSYPVKKSIGCGLACWAEPLCRSFNLWKQADDSKICQLNNATLLDADDVTDINNEENCFFYE